MKKMLFSLVTLICAISLTACNKGTEAPKAEAPKAEAPKAEAPKAEAPKAEAPKAEAPKAEEKEESASPVIAKRVYFTSPKNNAELKSPVKLVFGVDGMSIRPAGEDVNDKTSGHHHLIIDAAGIPSGQPVPMDKQHIHYGKGQTSATVELAPGKHTLRLQFADGAHLSYGPEMSSEITVNISK